MSDNRFDRVFARAKDKLDQDLEALFANHAAKGCLRSGATIKASVAVLDETTAAAVKESLAGIAAVTAHSGRKRRRLLAKLDSCIDAHLNGSEDIVRTRIEGIGLGDDFRHARPLIDKAALNQHAMVSDFKEGWTAPISRGWNERHPVYFAILVATVGAVLGAIVTKWITG